MGAVAAEVGLCLAGGCAARRGEKSGSAPLDLADLARRSEAHTYARRRCGARQKFAKSDEAHTTIHSLAP